MHITKNVFECLFGTLLNMPERTKDGVKARNDLRHFGIREELHGGRSNDDQSDEETDDGPPKGKKVRRKDYYCPLLLHSESGRDRAIDEVPSRNQGTFRLLGANKQISRCAEAEVQRDEVP